MRTVGKTTTALFVAAMLKRLGGAVAYYTSLGASDSTACDRTATRPPATRKLARWMERAELAGSPAAIIELTPSMLQQQVTAGVEFDVLILTGMRSSQLRGSSSQPGFGELMRHALGENLKPHGMLLYNADDASAAQWAEASGLDCVNYGLDAAQHVQGKRLGHSGGQQQLLTTTGNLLMPMTLKIPGDHVARTAMAAVAVAWMFDFSIPDAVAGIEALDAIPGMQRLSSAIEVPVHIDAAETPDRVAVALHALRQHQLGPTTVVMDLGCKLDPQWRQRLGEVLDKGADRVVLSSSDLSADMAQSLAMDVLGGFRRSRTGTSHRGSLSSDSLGHRPYRSRLDPIGWLWRQVVDRSRWHTWYGRVDCQASVQRQEQPCADSRAPAFSHRRPPPLIFPISLFSRLDTDLSDSLFMTYQAGRTEESNQTAASRSGW